MKWMPVVLYTAALTVGCATVKVPQPVGGSRADATVDMSFEFGLFEKPVIDWPAAAATAASRCAAWGYINAEPFGGEQSECLVRNGYGDCLRQKVTMTYQCTGTGTPPVVAK